MRGLAEHGRVGAGPVRERELDALVAEKVMGWRRAGGDVEWWQPHKDAPNQFRGRTKPDRFSSTGKGLLEVVEALAARGWDTKVYRVADTKGADAHVHRTPKEKFYESGPHASADTAPRAVCLAALKALGVEVA